MAKAEGWAKVVVCDAGPLIHLDELDCLDLVGDFPEMLVPEAVWHEVLRHRPAALDKKRLRCWCASPPHANQRHRCCVVFSRR
jgi:hypothetical protein